jgi:hypothetical protein
MNISYEEVKKRVYSIFKDDKYFSCFPIDLQKGMVNPENSILLCTILDNACLAITDLIQERYNEELTKVIGIIMEKGERIKELELQLVSYVVLSKGIEVSLEYRKEKKENKENG